MRYDDMMGLEMYNDDGMGAWITPEMLKEHLMAAGSGAVGILATSALVQKVLKTPAPPTDGSQTAEQRATQEKMWSNYRGLASVAVGILGGRFIYDYNRDAGMGFVGGVAGGALAQVLANLAGAPKDGDNAGIPYLTTNLAQTEWSPSAYSLSAYDLAALESTVATNAPSWAAGANGSLSALSAPVVREQSLAGTVTTTEDIASYMDAPPPSF